MKGSTLIRLVDEVPPALPSMWRALKRGYQAEPLLLPVAFGLSLLSALPDALMALWFKLLADGMLGGNRRLVLGAALGCGGSAAATWFLRVISDRTQRRFRDRVTIALESHVARLQASIATIAHQERPDYLDRLAVLRNQVFVLDHMYMSLFSTCGWILRLAATVVLLMSSWRPICRYDCPATTAALSPLFTKHLNPFGRFDLDLETRIPFRSAAVPQN